MVSGVVVGGGGGGQYQTGTYNHKISSIKYGRHLKHISEI